MKSDVGGYTLNSTQFEQALAILDKEREAQGLTPRRAKAAKLLSVLIYMFASAPPVITILALLKLTRTATVVGIAVVVIVQLGIVILFLGNLPYFVRLSRQRKAMRRLGLLDALRAPWREEQQKQRGRSVLDLGATVFALGMALVSFVLLVFVELYMMEGRSYGLASLITLGFVVAAIIVTFFARRSEARLRLLERYKEELLKSQRELDLGVTTQAYERIAEIERAQISRQRAESVLRDLKEAGVSFYVQKSRAVQDAEHRLDLDTRLRVQDQIDALTVDPRPPGIEREKEDVLRLSVPGTPLDIGFTVDDKAHLIRVLSLHSRVGDVSPSMEALS